MPGITLDQLQVLAELARTGSVSAAARSLHRAQSAVSYALKTLEGALGLALVDHAGYRAGLTPVGEAILAKAREALAGVEAVERLAEQLSGGVEPTLSLLLDGLLPTDRLMPALARLNERESPTRIVLRVELLGGLVQALQQHRPELVVAAWGQFSVPEAYDHEIVGSITLVPVVSAQHPLAREAAPVPLAVARRYVHLVITSPPGLQTPVDSGFIGAPRRWNFPDFATRLEGLRAGLGFAWMPTYRVEEALRSGALVPLVLERGNLHRHDVALIYRARPPLGPTGREVLEELRRQLALLPAIPQELLRTYEKS